MHEQFWVTLNYFMDAVSFKYEDLHIAILMFEVNDFLFKFLTWVWLPSLKYLGFW